MRLISTGSGFLPMVALLALPIAGSVSAQQAAADPNIVVKGMVLPTGPDIKGIIAARNGEKIKVLSPDGAATIIAVNEDTRVKSGGGLFGGGGSKYTPDQLLNGLPVTVKTWQGSDGLIASQITFKNNDMKTALMIRNGTNQRFEEQTAATEALRGRMADIDKYNVKDTTNVYFDTGKYTLTAAGKEQLCATSAKAEATDNALMLVIGYTDSVGSDEYNQTLSEKRASAVINYLQQACHWKPYRMLTPTGMAKADPAADNSTPEGKAQNRRVAVNVLVSKAIDGM